MSSTAQSSAQASLTPVQALNELVELVTCYARTQTFAAACKLGVFEHLSQPASPEDVAAKTGIHPTASRRLLVALSALDLVKQENGLFTNTELGSYCSSSGPVNLSAVI